MSDETRARLLASVGRAGRAEFDYRPLEMLCIGIGEGIAATEDPGLAYAFHALAASRGLPHILRTRRNVRSEGEMERAGRAYDFLTERGIPSGKAADTADSIVTGERIGTDVDLSLIREIQAQDGPRRKHDRLAANLEAGAQAMVLGVSYGIGCAIGAAGSYAARIAQWYL